MVRWPRARTSIGDNHLSSLSACFMDLSVATAGVSPLVTASRANRFVAEVLAGRGPPADAAPSPEPRRRRSPARHLRHDRQRAPAGPIAGTPSRNHENRRRRARKDRSRHQPAPVAQRARSRVGERVVRHACPRGRGARLRDFPSRFRARSDRGSRQDRHTALRMRREPKRQPPASRRTAPGGPDRRAQARIAGPMPAPPFTRPGPNRERRSNSARQGTRRTVRGSRPPTCRVASHRCRAWSGSRHAPCTA